VAARGSYTPEGVDSPAASLPIAGRGEDGGEGGAGGERGGGRLGDAAMAVRGAEADVAGAVRHGPRPPQRTEGTGGGSGDRTSGPTLQPSGPVLSCGRWHKPPIINCEMNHERPKEQTGLGLYLSRRPMHYMRCKYDRNLLVTSLAVDLFVPPCPDSIALSLDGAITGSLPPIKHPGHPRTRFLIGGFRVGCLWARSLGGRPLEGPRRGLHGGGVGLPGLRVPCRARGVARERRGPRGRAWGTALGNANDDTRQPAWVSALMSGEWEGRRVGPRCGYGTRGRGAAGCRGPPRRRCC